MQDSIMRDGIMSSGLGSVGRANPSQLNGRVLARALAEDLRGVFGGSRPTNNMLTAGVTDLGDLLDITYRGQRRRFRLIVRSAG